MAQTYDFKNAQNGSVIPVADGDFFTELMRQDHVIGHFYVEFFSDAAGNVPVSPTAGTLKVNCSPMGRNYIANGEVTINAIDCGSPNSNYDPIVFEGEAVKARVTLSGIAGAAYMRAHMWRV